LLKKHEILTYLPFLKSCRACHPSFVLL
jgi:hypothetical protein